MMFNPNKIRCIHFLNINSPLLKRILKYSTPTTIKIRLCSVSSTHSSDTSLQPVANVGKEVKISKAMKAYMERAKLYETFMKTQLDEYEIGRRHLANMMGEDPETFTQNDINRAVEYLMPSGLFEKKARPIFDHPAKLFPKRKDAEFDIAGRPFHYLFYTSRPNYTEALHEITEKTIQLNKYEDKMLASGIFKPEETEKTNLGGTKWVSKEQLENIFIEKITDNEYEQFITCVTRLAEHPYSAREKTYIDKFCVKLVAVTQTMEVIPLQYDENNRPFSEAIGYRKGSCASVIVRGNGTGQLDIDGRDLTYFESLQDREQLMSPLDFVGLLHKVDIEAKIIKGVGGSAQSGAIRFAISKALCSFVSKDMVERMRLAGLLTEDVRKRERQKVGQYGARAKYTWKKR